MFHRGFYRIDVFGAKKVNEMFIFVRCENSYSNVSDNWF